MTGAGHQSACVQLQRLHHKAPGVQGCNVVVAGMRKASMRLRITYGWGRRDQPSEDGWLARSPLARRFMGRNTRRVCPSLARPS